MDGLLRMTIPALKRPTAASHMIAMNDDGTWIGAIQIIDQGCNTISMLDNCATCDALRCFKCANNTYLDDNICVQKCTGGRIPIDDGSYGVGKYCAGMSDNDITFGKVKGTHVVPVAPCKKDVTYVGTCTSTVAECPLKRVMNLDACKLACEQDLECVALTYDSKEQKCWVWNTKTTERATTTIEGDYISCTSTSQLQKISDAATITVLWEDSDLSSSSLLWSEHLKKECDTATATLQTSKPVETKEMCTFMCNNDKACDGFTYDSKNKICTLLHGCSATKAATGAAATDTSTLLMSSRTTMCQWETISKKKCNTGGDDKTLVDRGQIGPLACRLLCAAQSTASCQCYSIKSSDGTCYLSQATAIALESDVTYTSYKKGTCSKGYYDGDVTTDKNGKNWVEHLFPIVPLTSSVEKEYMTKKLPYKIETIRCKDKTNAITSWDKCKAANIALQVQEQRRNIFSCREKSSTGSCSTFYKGCTKCNNDAFNLDKYAPWNYTMAQQYCMAKPLNTAIVTKYDATKSWAQAKLFCEAKGARLPTRDELCPSGKDSEPVGGYCDGKGTDRWAAVSDVTNEYVGCSSDLSGDGKKRGCYTHTEHTGVVPTWATDSTGRWHGYVYCAEGETYQGPPSDLFQNKACPDDVGTYAFPIGTQENSDNWPYGCIEIEGEGLYFNGKTDSTELEVGNGKTIRSLCNIPVIFSQRESESTTAKLGVTSHIQLNYPLLDIPMRKRSACPLAYPYPLEYTTDNWYCYKESDGNTAGGDECSYFGNLPTPSGQGSWNENKADCSSITTPVSDNPKHVVVVVDHGTKDSAWKSGVQIIRSPIEDRGCEFGCGRCDAADHCLECHLSMFLSGGKCHKQCMLGDTVVLPINTIGGVCLPCFHPPLPTIACQDIPGWQDTSTYTCNDYRTNGWCVGNKIVNTNYKDYGAETNCCDCGKDATVPSTSNKIPHLSIKRTHASTDVSFIVPSTRTFQLQVHKNDVSTTHEMILHIKSGHDLFNYKDNIPSVTMSGIENSNCIVTSISTTAKTLRISLTPIQSSTPCIFAQGNIVNVTLINTDCKQCLAANPLPNQMIRTTIQWSSISATARTTSISSSSCPTSWYKTKPTRTCKSPNGRTSHRDIKAENIGYKTRIDLSCDRNKENECDISLKKYVASDGTIVTSTHDAGVDVTTGTETKLSYLFDQSLTTKQFFPPDSYFRTASKTTDNTIKLVFQEPKRLSNIKYRPTFSGYTSGQQGTQQMIKYKITIKEAYVNAPNGIQFTDLVLDDWRMCRTGKETQRSRYKTAVEKNCPGQWTNQGWNHLFTYGYSVDLPVPNPDWSSLYGKRPMFVKEVWIEMKYVHNKIYGNIGTGMDELEIWEYSSDQGMSNDQCGCGGTSQIVPDPTFSITFNKGVATMFPSQLKGTNGLMQTMDTAVVKTNSDIKKWTNPTGRPWTYSYLPTGAHRIALFSFDHDANTNSWEGETSTKDLVDLSYVGGPLKLVSGDDAMSTPPNLNKYAGPGSFLTSANSVKYMKWEKRSTAYTLGSSGKDRTWIAWYKGSQKENENGQWQCTVSIFGDETKNVAAGLGIENGKICIGNDGTQIGTTNVADDKWHMLAWTYKQSTQVMTAYVDVAGVMTAEATMTTWTRPEDCHLWNIGGGSVVDGHKSPDKLDEVAVYQTEIAKEYLQDLYDVYMANKAHEPRLHAVIGPDGTYSGIDTIKGNALKIMRDDSAQGYDLSSQWTMDFFTKGPYTHLPNIQYPSTYTNIKYHALTRGYSQDEQMLIESSGWVGTRIGNSFEHMSPKGNKIMFEGKGEWKRVTIVAKGGKTYFYLDTVLWGTASKSSKSEILFLGTAGIGTYLHTNDAQGPAYHDWGKLADFRVWKYALTTEQISELPNTKNTKIKTEEYISPTRECKRGEYCIAEVGKCMPNIHPVATPTWLGERNCGCGITQFAGFCSQCDHYLCTGTCRWPMCDDIDDIVYNDYNHNNIVDQKNNLILKKDQNKNKLYDHPCRCSSFSSWSLATPTKMSELAVDTTMTNHQYIMTNDTSYWMSPMTDQLWSYTTPKPIYGTWEYNENGWNPTLKKETAVTTNTVSNGKTARVMLWGAGGSSAFGSYYLGAQGGGSGGYLEIDVPCDNTAYAIVVGHGGLAPTTGKDLSNGQYGGGANHNYVANKHSGNGGGLSGLFTGTATANALKVDVEANNLVAYALVGGGGGGGTIGLGNCNGGGGGGACSNKDDTACVGGDGRGPEISGNSMNGGKGGTKSEGGAGGAKSGKGIPGLKGSRINGGRGPGGGGGGGYNGGGGGGSDYGTDGTGTGAGGGSGFLDAKLLNRGWHISGQSGINGGSKIINGICDPNPQTAGNCGSDCNDFQGKGGAAPRSDSTYYQGRVGVGGTAKKGDVTSEAGGNGMIVFDMGDGNVKVFKETTENNGIQYFTCSSTQPIPPPPTVESFACTSSTAKTDINGGVGSSIGFGCVFKDNKDKRYVRPKSISTEYNKVAMISLESIWSTIDSGEFGFVDRAPRSALVYVRSEITNPVCSHKGQCTKTSSFDVLNTCTETCSINRLLERKCKCGSGGSDPTCIPGDQCTSDNKCIQQCKEGQWSSEDKCICGNGPTKADRKTCDQGEACHHETGTCVKDPCLFQDGKGTTSNICVCAGPTESEICMKGQYCIGGPNEKPCQSKCNGIITAALACINKDTEKIYKPRTIRTIDPFGLERERKFRRD